MHRRAFAIVILFISAFCAAPEPARSQELTSATYDRLKAIVDVKPEELRWQQVEWRSCWDGLVEAQKLDRPIFYWVYFGDPRGGC